MSNLTWDYSLTPTIAGDFPQLALFADRAAARAQLSAALGGLEAGRALDIDAVRYIAGRALEVVYRLDDGARVAVRFLRPGESRAAYAAAAARSAYPALVGHLPAWEAVAWRLPADPGDLAVAALAARTAAMAGADPDDHAILSYLPGERCALRCGPPAAGVVGKLRAGSGAQASHAGALRLWRSPRRRFAMPEPLAADEAAGMRWERFVPGVRLEQALLDQAPGPLLAEVARGLAGLHALDPAGLPPQGPAELLRRVRKVLRRLAVALPALLPAAERLAAALAAATPAAAARPRLIHGDLHTANVIIGHGGPAFIDLDSLAAGDPDYDLALLGSRIILSAALRGAPLAAARELAAALPWHYAAAGGAPRGAATYAWYTAALLLARQVKTCLRNADPGAARTAAALLAAAHQIITKELP